MQKYQTLKKLGSGSFGNVEKAENIQTHEIVAIKGLKKKYGTWDECLQLAEVKALRKLNHPCIIKLKEVIRVVNEAYFVFEFIEKDLFKMMTEKKEKGQKMEEYQIRHISKQLVEAVQYIHKNGFFHRDLKPENILISPDSTIKIIDFGIAREIRSKPPFTEYISTRWYRAPQLLFRFPTYSIAVDIFAIGCIVAEMYLGRPMFLGNSEMDQISKITSVLGSPEVSWPQGMKQAAKKGINLPEYPELSLSSVIPNCPQDALNFISQCLRWDPLKRITTFQMLSHPFLLKQSLQTKSLHIKKHVSDTSQQINYKIKNTDKQDSISLQSQKLAYSKEEDDFDGLLNDFKNFQLSGKKESKEDEEEWF